MKESLSKKLFEAVRLSEVETVKALIDAGADVNFSRKLKERSKGWRSKRPCEKIFFIDRTTPLFCALETASITYLNTGLIWRQYQIVKMLLEAGADVDFVACVEDDYSIKDLAYQHNHTKELLLKALTCCAHKAIKERDLVKSKRLLKAAASLKDY